MHKEERLKRNHRGLFTRRHLHPDYSIVLLAEIVSGPTVYIAEAQSRPNQGSAWLKSADEIRLVLHREYLGRGTVAL
jgi:hypothetical protein